MQQKKNIIEMAKGTRKASFVIKNGKIIDVFSHEILEMDVAIHDGKIIGLGNFEGEVEWDAQGMYIAPGFIDGHVHIESSMVLPEEFSKVVLPRGVTSVVTDPHEIANVLGTKGIERMIESSKNADLDIYFMLPSCVPATPFETSGATLLAKDLAPLMECEEVIGLAEVMNYPAVMNGDEDMLGKIQLAKDYGKKVDGHGAGLSLEGLNVYRSVGIETDHECISPEEVKERIQRGFYVLLREGSGARNLKTLLKGINEYNARRCLLCTDDKHIDDLVDEGSIDYNIRLCIEEGLHPITAIQMATINAAACYGLETKGAVAPGYDADLVFLSHLEDVSIKRVMKNGVFYDERRENTEENLIQNTMNIAPFSVEDFTIPMKKGNKANVIELIPNSIVTKHTVMDVHVQNEEFIPSVEEDTAYLSVVERHHGTGNIGMGIVKGFGLRKGAIASTVAHDSHHLVCAGMTKEDMAFATKVLKEIGGGLVIVENGRVVASLELPFGGLMSYKSYEEVYNETILLNEKLAEVSTVRHFNAFLLLSFLALPVIPALKLTDKGLFHVSSFKHIQVEA